MSTKTILIIDDEPDIITYLSTLLTNQGYQVITANNAFDGIDLAINNLPDLICLDIIMPKKSGITLYKDLKTDNNLRKKPTIIISAVESPASFKGDKFKQLVQDTSIPEPNAFFEKPIAIDKFLQVIKGLL